MPAYVTHTLFAQLCLEALAEARHPLSGPARRHAGLFRVAGIAGCDIQCMPYQVCRACEAPYRHDQGRSRRCLVCGREALEDFSFDAGGRRMGRREVEQELYGNTHLVLYRKYRGYGVPPELNKPGPAQQPLPRHAVSHLANTLRDAEAVAGKSGQVGRYLAFTLGWFAHVVSDALFKGLYPHAAKVSFFGTQYGMAMLPAAETLTMTDIARDFGVDWPAWHRELLRDEPDGGALNRLAMGDAPAAYGPHWTAAHGKPDEAIGRVIDAVRPLNRLWFHRMYVQPDYSAPSPRLDKPQAKDLTELRFGPKRLDLGQVRRHAIGSGWYDTFLRGVEIYVTAVSEAAESAGYDARGGGGSGIGAAVDAGANGGPAEEADSQKMPPGPAVGWSLWREVVTEAVGRSKLLPEEWGSRTETPQDAAASLAKLRGGVARLSVPGSSTESQRALSEHLKERLRIRHDAVATATVVVGPPAFNDGALPLLCHEDALRLKYGEGLAALVRADRPTGTLLLAGLSHFGDQKLIEWVEDVARS
jgi:hypothetical protein